MYFVVCLYEDGFLRRGTKITVPTGRVLFAPVEMTGDYTELGI